MFDIPPIEILGFIAGFFGSFSSLPQSYKIIKTRDASTVSLPTFLMLFLAFSLWMIYGIFVGAVSIIFWNAIASLLALITIYLKLTVKKPVI